MDSSPRVSVVIRSYERGGALIELIEAVLGQRGVASFEIVVVEQSRRLSAAHIARLDELWRTAGVRILKRPPLGGPGARNAGTRAARGEILVFMDDDDLPADDHWLAAHLANFDDPNCLAVTGRQLLPERPGQPYRNMARAREQVCSFVPILMWQRCFTAADQRRVVDNVHGGNVSIRRSTLERFGLWDECTRIEDELSFNYRLVRGKRPEEYVVFDPHAKMIRRLDVPGGMDKRRLGVSALGERVFEFLHRIIGYYFPVRFVALYPAYVVLLYLVCADWVWNDLRNQGSRARRVRVLVQLLASLPVLWLMWSVKLARRRLREGPARYGVERVPLLAPITTGA